MQPKDLIRKWVEYFNLADADNISDLYAENAVNHQVPEKPLRGRKAIRQMFVDEFNRAQMVLFGRESF
ncbi:MAG: hypothetical protein Kow0037_04310 [Calditrichia bacterium]